MIAGRPIVVGIGEVLWDVLPSGRTMGGAPANFTFHAQALGAEGLLVSAVGDDEPGREILRSLEAGGLDPRGVAVLDAAPTGAVIVRLDPRGVPSYDIREGAAWDFLPWTREAEAAAGRADAVCFGTLAQRSETSRRTIRRFLEAVRPAGLRIFDINLRQSFYGREIIHELLGLSNVLKLNDKELAVVARLLGLPGPETDALQRLLEAYPLDMIALTKGEAGSRLIGRGRDILHPGCPADMADSVGAGDAFAAALAVGLLKNKPWDEISEKANRVAGFVCSRPGAWPPLPADLASWPSDEL